MTDPIEANFSTLILSIASAASMALGEQADPRTGAQKVDLKMASFNIDLLKVLKEKTKGNLSEEEGDFVTSIISDLQMRYVSKK